MVKRYKLKLMQRTETKLKTTLHVCKDKNLGRTLHNFIPRHYSPVIRKWSRLQRQYYTDFTNHSKSRSRIKPTQKHNTKTMKRMGQGRGR